MRSAAGEPVWLTVPVRTKGRFGSLPIDELEVDNGRNWRRRHLATLEQAYARAPHFDEHRAWLTGVYGREWSLLAGLCAETTGYLLDALAIETPLVRSSELDPRGAKDELVLDLCRKVGATTYLSGALGRDYLREGLFTEVGIRVVYQDYRHPSYPQLGKPFLPAMSIVDLLFNVGPASREVVLAGGEEPA